MKSRELGSIEKQWHLVVQESLEVVGRADTWLRRHVKARNTQGGMLQNASNLPQRLDMYRMPISNVFLVVHFFLSTVPMSISPSVQELTF